jgi:outer membrane biosynthesis protein TonB
MKFSSLAVLAVVAQSAAAFAPTANQRQFAVTNVAFKSTSSSSSARRSAMSMDLSDLENKLLTAPATKASKAPAAKATQTVSNKVKEEKPKQEKKQNKRPEPKPTPAPTPTGKVSYDLGGVDIPAPKKDPPRVKTVKPKKAAPEIKQKVVKAVKPPREKRIAPPKAPAAQEPNALPAGVALGLAPLIAAPFIALTAGRGILAGTKARREKIQQEIDDAAAAKKKKIVLADVDAGGVTKALVRTLSSKSLYLNIFRRKVICMSSHIF